MAKYSSDYDISIFSAEIKAITQLLNQLLNEVAETNRLMRLLMKSPTKSQTTTDDVPIV